ncbi:SusC/RagA family TonB-linked outer membrane protein [Desertivirga brevis]|uniref:SusC/RagA family TonB-linked outer membrane protein n=1 Tax=Desertivirga brevis TaxID=2810310 RepID=UPI001A957C49|nr:SusC/RagA family TonB-linked outer membrane protein [Pedobacter sp. SYSU D00873]
MRRIYTKGYVFLYAMLLFPLIALAQTGSLTGKVSDEKNEPLPGASVVIKSLSKGTSTDPNGNFKITGLNNGSVSVQVTFIGYQPLTKTVNISGATTLNIQLQPSAQSLNEVVVIGYGSQQKNDVTGSITTVTSKDFQKGNVTSPEQLITGKVAGVQITSSGGQPGGSSTIRIRGGASLNASNDPLIVVDGVPLSSSSISGVGNALSLINPNDIESMNVLKDANATAIYGSRASNGVILITTKKGQSGRLTFNFNSQAALANASRTLNVLSADQVREYVNANGTDVQKALLGTANTNWYDQIYREAFTSDNNLSVTGSYKKVPFRVSLGYLDNDGILQRDNMKRTSGALSVSPSLFNKHLKIDLNIKGSLSESFFGNQSAITSAAQFDPTQSVYADNSFGGYYEWQTDPSTPNPNAPRNPVGLLNTKSDSSKVARSFGNIKFDYSFHFLPELHANLNLGYDVAKGKGGTFIPAFAASNIGTKGNITRYDNNYSNKVAEFYLNYAKDLKSINSNINATAGYGYYAYRTRNNNFPTYQADATTVISQPVYPYDIPENRLLSYYGRVIYTLANKYIVSGTVRTDGSSRFSEENRWGVFPSAAFTWKVKQEDFLASNNNISDLKLRLSYGVTGQQEGIDNYYYLPTYYSSSNESRYQIGNEFYYMSTPVPYNSDLKWETTTTSNAGIDYGFLNGRISGSIDVYYKKTKDLISRVPVSVGSNFSNFLTINLGNMENKGVEFSLSANPVRKKNMNWDLSFNATHNKSKITRLNSDVILTGGITGATGNFIQAHAINNTPYAFYTYKQIYDGNGRPIQGAYQDLNNDGSINNADRYLYNSPVPKWILGFSSSFNYQKWTLSTVLRSSLGNYLYDNISANFATASNIISPAGLINNATSDFLNTGFTNNEFYSDYYIKNASFLKMDNLGLSYDFGRVVKGISSFNISANVRNVFTVTKYKGVDPEVQNGIDYNLYPRPRTFVLGINVGF